MSNALHRSGYVQTFPATPYVPYRPAYTYVEPVFGYIRPNGWGMNATSSSTASPTPSGSGTLLPNGTWLPEGYNVVVGGVSPPPSGGVSVPAGGSQPSYGVIGYDIITVPEQAEQQGSPGGRLSVPPPGWTAFARSARGIPAGEARFTVPLGVSGVVIGLAEYAEPNGGYGHIRHGLRFGGNHVYNARTGEDLGEYFEEGLFSIVYNGMSVQFLASDEELDSEPSTYRTEPLYLTAALYDVGDTVDNPELEAFGFGQSETALPMMLSFAFESDYAESITVLPPLKADAGTGDFAHTMLPALAGLSGSNGLYGAVIAALPALTTMSYGGMVPGVGVSASEVSLPVLVGMALGLTGETGDAEVSLPVLAVLASEASYGEAKVTLPAMSVFAFTEGNNEAYALETLATAATVAGNTTLLAVVLEHITLGTTAVTTTLIDAVIQELINAAPSVATEQLLEVVARTFVQAGSSGLLEGATGRTDQDTWVWHAEAAGSTMYRSYRFNSFAVIDGKHYGASADGVFLLEGDDDAGAPIRASFDLGKLDFGTSSQKTIAECYVGMSASGNLFLKIIAEGREFIYKTRGFSEHMQQQRFTPGKGLKSNYVTVQFFNEDGADFEIDTVNFLVADLQRKI